MGQIYVKIYKGCCEAASGKGGGLRALLGPEDSLCQDNVGLTVP